MRDYKVQSVPTIVLDGEYNIRATLKTSPERVAAVAEFMAEKLSHGGARP
jgi:hypothetical protein